MGYSVHREDFESLAAIWDDLERLNPTRSIFSGLDWSKLWWKHFAKDKELFIHSVRDGQECIGIAPLVRNGDTISFIGDTDVSDYMDFIITPGKEEQFLTALLTYASSEGWDHMSLHCMRQDSSTITILSDICAEMGYSNSLEVEDVCPTVGLPDSWEGYLSALSRKDRHELRRKMRRLEGAGRMSYYYVNGDNGLDPALDDFLVLHRQSREEKAAFMTPDMEDFFKDFSRHFISKGQQRLYFMEVDGVRLSANICFDYGSTLYLYNSGYNPNYAHLSVGLLLKALCIKEAIEAGKEVFDFLRGNERYKYDLGGVDAPIYHQVITRE
ncbi:MAG: hypothetical protein HW403_432 [Dehalococcoidia bacterium]|nr:hypothetical protein [Dehalococcoidia bacterium]